MPPPPTPPVAAGAHAHASNSPPPDATPYPAQVSPFKKEGESERYIEEGLITAGDDVNSCLRFMKQDADGEWGYSARDVVDYLASEFKTAAEMEECPTELVEEPVAVGSSDLA